MVKKISKFMAQDGTLYDTKEAAEAHDAGHKWDKLVGLTTEDLEKIAARDPAYKAHGDAIEGLANKIMRARRKAGDLLRPYAGRKAGEAAPAAAPAPEAAPAQAPAEEAAAA